MIAAEAFVSAVTAVARTVAPRVRAVAEVCPVEPVVPPKASNRSFQVVCRLVFAVPAAVLAVLAVVCAAPAAVLAVVAVFCAV